MLFLVRIGANDEEKRINGTSHFLEHLFFKGTKNRPKPGQVMRDLDRVGAQWNAFTGRETTCFWVKSSVKDFDYVLDIVSDIMLNPLFVEKEIEKERGVILQEISMYEDIPQQKVGEELEYLMFGDQSAGRPITGTKESVSNISRSDIVSYRKRGYTAGNAVFAVAGGMDGGEIFEKTAGVFGKFSSGKNPKRHVFFEMQKSPFIKLINKVSDQSHLALGIKTGFGREDKNRFTLKVLNTIFGGNTSSRLFNEIRQKLGLAYYVGSGVSLFESFGVLGIAAGVSHGNLLKTADKIFETAKDMRLKGVSKTELKEAKSNLLGHLALGLETTDDIAEYVAEQEMFYGKINQPEELAKNIEKVTQNDILGLSRRLFDSGKTSYASIGDISRSAAGEKDLLKIIKKYF